MKLKNVKTFFTNPIERFNILSSRGILNFLSDENYIKKSYKINIGRELNLKDPKTFNEKLQWLKLHDRKELYTILVDKCEVKKYVADIIGEEYVIPTYGVWNSVDEVDFDTLPNQFVLKCTHDSGGVAVVKDKSKLDLEALKQNLNKRLKRNYFYSGREWAYKNVKPRILAEKYLECGEQLAPEDYKFLCFDGEAKIMYVASERFEKEEPCFDFYDMEFNHLKFTNGHPNSKRKLDKPVNFELMKQLAEELANGFPHIRVDFYEANGKVYFGELTLIHMSGFAPFDPYEWDIRLGEWLKLPNNDEV